MNGKNLIIFGLIILIHVCFRRQRRHFIELAANSPSKSIKAAFQMTAITLFVAFILPSETLDFKTLVYIATIFCAKVVFSSAIVGITLTICLVNFITFDQFSFYAVYNCLMSMILWNLSEDVRDALTRISFVWLLISPIVNKTIDLLLHI